MAYEHKAGYFNLFKNTKKNKDSQPDYQGDGASLDGSPIEIAAWLKDGKGGGKYLSCKMSEPRQQNEQPAAARPVATKPLDESEIPF